MVTDPRRTEQEVEAPLEAWRRKATGLLVAATAVFYLPAAVMVAVPRPDLPASLFGRVALEGCYVAILGLAAARGLRPRVRGWAFLATCYALVMLALVMTGGPFGKALLVVMPAFALALLGARAGRFAAVVSALLLVVSLVPPFAPFLVGFFSTTGAPLTPPTPTGVAVVQVLGLLGLLLSTTALLERFHLFLLERLVAERHTSAQLVQEAARREAAHRALEEEMQARRRLERELAQVGDRERQRWGQEVHDGVCQELTGALLRCQAVQRRLREGGAVGEEDVGALSLRLQEALQEAQTVARGLWPLEADPQALARGLRALVRRAAEEGNGRGEFRTEGRVEAPDPEVAQHLYRIAQEALSNAVRHARATSLLVELCGEGERLLLQVSDDGVGLPEAPNSGGLGLRTMAYRAQLLEGELQVARGPEGGTRVVCRVPRTLAAPPAPGGAVDGE